MSVGWARTITETRFVPAAACAVVARAPALSMRAVAVAIALTLRRLRSSQLMPCTGAIPWQPPVLVPACGTVFPPLIRLG